MRYTVQACRGCWQGSGGSYPGKQEGPPTRTPARLPCTLNSIPSLLSLTWSHTCGAKGRGGRAGGREDQRKGRGDSGPRAKTPGGPTPHPGAPSPKPHTPGKLQKTHQETPLPAGGAEDQLGIALLKQRAALLPKQSGAAPVQATLLSLSADGAKHPHETQGLLGRTPPVFQGEWHKESSSKGVPASLASRGIGSCPAGLAGPGPKPSSQTPSARIAPCAPSFAPSFSPGP